MFKNSLASLYCTGRKESSLTMPGLKISTDYFPEASLIKVKLISANAVSKDLSLTRAHKVAD